MAFARQCLDTDAIYLSIDLAPPAFAPCETRFYNDRAHHLYLFHLFAIASGHVLLNQVELRKPTQWTGRRIPFGIYR